MIGRADIEGSKSNVAMNAWLPQAAYPRDDEAFGYLKRAVVRRPGKVPEGTLPSVPRPARGDPLSPRGAARAVHRQPTGSGPGPPCPAPRSQSFSRGYGSILPTSLAYIVPSTAGRSPWRPDAVMSTTGVNGTRSSGFSRVAGGAPTPRDVRCSSARRTLPPPSRFDRLTHVQVPFTWNLSPLRPSKFSFEYLLLPPRSAPTAAPPGSRPRFCSRPPRPPTHRGSALAPTAGYRSRA
ncbi:unnamed protein product [Prunus brigantina]